MSEPNFTHRIICKGNCPICGKELGEEDNIFICKECCQKEREEREKHEQTPT